MNSKGNEHKNQLHHCLRFAETFPEQERVYAVRRQLSWTHIRSLLYIDDALKRDFYLHMAKYEQEADELFPIGIILCTGKKQEQVELLEMSKSGIHVAEYLTSLPPKEVLEQRLHQAIINAKRRLLSEPTDEEEIL